ncbi:MAG: right-handed parallel beta-helix repeat-containing protein, partial [Ignavibacteriaceae bacterium]
SGPVTLELIDSLYTSPANETGFLLNGPIPGVNPNSRVTIRPATNKNVRFQGNGKYIVTFQNTSFLNFDGVSTETGTSLTFYSQYNSAFDRNRAVNFSGNSDHNIIQNLTCIGEDIYRYGDLIVIGPTNASSVPDSNLIQNNFIKQGGGSITVGGLSTSYRARGNIVRNNKIGSETDSLISWGIHLEWCQNSLVENNIVQNLKVTTTYGSDILIPGINCYGGLEDTIRNNVVHNIRSSSGYTSTGILLSGSSNSQGNRNIIYNNMVYVIQSTSTSTNNRVAGIQMWYQSNPKVYYNSVYLSGTGQNKYGSAALYISISCTNVEVKNNVLANTRDESPYCASSIYTIVNLTSDNNDLYYEPNQYSCLVRIGSTKYNTLSDWQAEGKDLLSVTEMPKFIKPDLHIDESIPTNLEKRAVLIAGIDIDIDGDPRNTDLPDIGADEFTGNVVPGPLMSGYSVGVKGYFPTIDSVFNRLSTDGISGPVTLELI